MHCFWEYNMAQLLRASVAVPVNVNHRIITRPRNSALGSTPQIIENSQSNKCVYIDVRSSTIHNSQRVEAT